MSTWVEIERAARQLSAHERKLLLTRISEELEADSRVHEPPAGYGGALAERRLFTLEEYLEIERSSPLRHEYVAGEIFAMGQPRQAHELVAVTLAAALRSHLGGHPCRTYAGGRMLHFKCRGDDIAYYPDVWVGCGESRNAQGEFDDEPRLVIEVLSPSTARIDRREKALNYREIPSLQEFVLVDPKPVRLVIHRRAEQWSPIVLEAPDALLELRSVGLTLSAGQIYEGVP